MVVGETYNYRMKYFHAWKSCGYTNVRQYWGIRPRMQTEERKSASAASSTVRNLLLWKKCFLLCGENKKETEKRSWEEEVGFGRFLDDIN